MKKNKMMRIASVLLVAVLLSTSAISGTYAKYVSTSTGTDSARVALWKFTIDDTDIITTSNTFTFDLFNTSYEESNVDKEGIDNNAVVIAPGTTGFATVTLKNISEVNATYEVAFSAEESGIPLQWSVDGTDWKNNISELDISATAINMNDDADITIHWMWAFESDVIVKADQSDTIDTNLGTAGTATVTFTATVTVTQVN